MTSSPPSPASPTSPVINPLQCSVAYLITKGEMIDDVMLTQCAQLFSNNYGVWGKEASTRISPVLAAGHRVRMNASRLRAQCVGNPLQTRLVTAHIEGVLVAHAFATRWESPSGPIGWITQLVVDITQRRRYHASLLLRVLRADELLKDISIFGLVSSHPAACHALTKLAGIDIDNIDLGFIKEHAPVALSSTTVDYLKTAELRGSLFDPETTSGAVSTVFTDFWVDHTEPLEALHNYQSRDQWCMGDLLDGHEFLIMVRAEGQKGSPTGGVELKM